MLTKAQIKFVQSLQDKKQRIASGMFVVEGNKIVTELLQSKIHVNTLFATQEWFTTNLISLSDTTETLICSKSELEKLSSLPSAPQVLAIAALPESENFRPEKTDFIILLDTIQDPGNMGTIIRIADWYGVNAIIYSPGCADPYSPKVIQSSMGSFMRVKLVNAELEDYLNTSNLPVYGAVMNGKSLYKENIHSGILLIGNEGHGISENLIPFITNPVTIPSMGGAESLNAAIATAVICDARARFMSEN